MGAVIQVEHLSKQYRLGLVGTGTLRHDLNRWWHRVLGKEDPYLKIGDVNDRSSKGTSDYVWALKDINFEVPQGEVLGIIGRNGAGKSTLLKVMSRTTAPSIGRIRIRGRVASLLEVGTGFHPELTGKENVYLNGAILGMKKQEIDCKFDEIVDFAGVERYIDTPVKRYSSGMYVRLAFGVAAHLESEILIVDEVLAVGDVEFQKKSLGKMGEVSRNGGKTVLFVSHNMTSIGSLCNKVLVMKDGQVDFHGEVKSGLNHYINNMQHLADTTDLQDILRRLPQDEYFELLGFDMQQEESDGDMYVTHRPIELVFSYRILKPITGLRVGFEVMEKKSELTLFSVFHDDAYQEIIPWSPGVYASRATLDANLLREASYIINLTVCIHNVRWILNGQVKLPLEVRNLVGITALYGFEKRPGYLLPPISWENRSV
ncbi:MAG: ABC transporter ATP-binding protein [Bacteroidetes bacterium]|nr:ABC transporter ATP-binding protein [Bacteroidota bacterium]